jgi:hypothetical protein
MLGAAQQAAPAAHVLEDVINLNRYYAIKTIEDFDIIQHHEVQNKLDAIRNRYVAEAKTKLAECKRKMIPGSKAAPLLQKIEQLVFANNIIDAKKALDLFSEIRNWQYENYHIRYAQESQKEPELKYKHVTIEAINLPVLDFLNKEIIIVNKEKELNLEIETYNSNKRKAWLEKKDHKTVRNIAIFVAILIVLMITGAVISNNSGKDFYKSGNNPISDQTVKHTPDTIYTYTVEAGKYEKINYSKMEWTELTDIAFEKAEIANGFQVKINKWVAESKKNLDGTSDGAILGESLTKINEFLNVTEEITKRLENDQAPYSRYKNKEKFIKNVKINIFNYYFWNNVADERIDFIKKVVKTDNEHKLVTYKHEIDISRLVDILKEIDPQSEGKSIKEIANDYEQSSRQ